MKVKTIKIKIKSLDESLDEFVKVAEDVSKGKRVRQRSNMYVADAATARGIFTESRLRIIQLLKNEEVSSIYELAKMLGRDFKNVSEDICFLSDLGIIKISEAKSGRKQKKPTLVCDNLMFEIAA